MKPTTLTTAFALACIVTVLASDILAWRLWGYEATITANVRGWNAVSVWPEVVFVVGAVWAYLHLFRGVG